MVRNDALSGALAILLAALPAASQTLDAKSVLNNSVKAMGAENLKTLEYSGSGSIYAVGPRAEDSVRTTVTRYAREVDLQALASRVEITQVEGRPPVEHRRTEILNAKSPWSAQFDFWITPFGFLKGAAANNATAEPQTVLGEHYTAVTFALQNKYKVTGFINGKNMVEKVRTSVEGAGGDRAVEVIYRDYADFGGLKFPTLVIEKQSDILSLIVVVGEVKPNAAVSIPSNQSGN